MIEVRTSYTFDGSFTLDGAAEKAAGRASDFSGCGTQSGNRDLGWVCKSELEAEKIKRALDKIGLRAEIRAADGEKPTRAENVRSDPDAR